MDEIVIGNIRIEKRYIIGFVSSVIIGLICHGFAMTNFITGKDSIGRVNEVGVTLTSGRWGLELCRIVVTELFGGVYSISYFNILLSIIMASTGAMLIANLFKIRSNIAVILIGGIFVSYPSLSHTMIFIYTVPYYMFALILSIIAGCMFIKTGIKEALIGIIVSVFAMSIYQAYLPVTAMIIVLYLMCECIGKKDSEALLSKYVKIALLFLISVIVYIVITKLLLALVGSGLSDYKSISTMGMIEGPKDIIERLSRTYWYTLGYPFKTFHMINYNFFSKTCMIGLYIIISVFILKILRALSIQNRILFILAILISPICFNFIYIMVPDKNSISALMCYSTVGIFLMFPILADRYYKILNSKNIIRAGVIISLLLIFEFAWFANGFYNAHWYTLKQAESYYEVMISAIKSVEGYSEKFPVSIVGVIDSDEYTQGEGFEQFGLWNTTIGSQISRAWTFKGFLKYHLGFSPIWEDIDLTKEENRLIVDSMPTYPSDGSIRIIDGHVVIKGVEPKD